MTDDPKEDECLECDGTGNVNYDCEECEGKGWVDDPSDGGTMCCPTCNGEEPCPDCGGTGEIE